ncbi:MAG: N-acetylglucosamine-6-phosphate deacetylase [Defluviitaleaceae bacterium]|nr:N-acetylglucosamine-6-phosphate deacetylase [Defluviitaleaceae bacterium]
MQLIVTGKSISDGVEKNGAVFAVENGAIVGVGGTELLDANRSVKPIDLKGFACLPGFVDIHAHGGSGFDTMDGTRTALNGMSLHKAKEGVTSFMPSTVTASGAATESAISGISEALSIGTDGAKIIGVFLEGPYINPKNKGAHPAEYIRPIDPVEIFEFAKKCAAKLSPDGRKRTLSVAVAPELPGGPEAIGKLAASGINVRVGHSSATYSETLESVRLGANLSIHTYNAMSPLNHREPGMVGAVMDCRDIYAEIICDMVHVHPAAVRVLVNAKGADKIVMVTDCMRAGGLSDGEYGLGEMTVYVRGGEARLADGTLAGSTATVAGCLKNMVNHVGVALCDAVKMATSNPAKAVGQFDAIGSLDVGKRADITAIDAEMNVRFVMADGKILLDKR